MIALLTLMLFTCGALGAGSMAVQVSGIRKSLTLNEDITLSLTLGTGLVGWLMFFPGIMGHLSSTVIAVVVGVCCLGIIPLWSQFSRAKENISQAPFSYFEKIIISGLAIVIIFDFFEAYAPQADADTMAYHFATPSLFLRQGAVEFIPRAIDGAIPLLQQMGYAATLSVGGELAANFWLAATGWTLGGMTYIVTARLVSRSWALVTTLLVMTVPAVSYGAGTGQVETRAAAYVVLAAFAVYLAIKEDSLGFVWIAAIATGLFFGTKYTGLLLGFACGVVFILQSKHRITYAAFFSIVTVLVGVQWYIFNFYHSGDPIFPVLWGVVDYTVNFPWSDAQNTHFREWSRLMETPLAKNIFWFFAYPFYATLNPLPQFESSKVGLGITWLLLLPLASIGAWGMGRHFFRSPAGVFIIVCLIYYAIWFFFGPSQRVRHMLPIYPLLLIAFASLSHQAIRHWQSLSIPCTTALMLVALIQIGGQTIVALKYIDYAISEKSPSDFLRNNIIGYDVVVALNTMLDDTERVLVSDRPWLYRLQVPYFYAHPDLQNEVMLRREDKDPTLFLKQLNNKSITHIVALPLHLTRPELHSPLQKFMKTLYDENCVSIVRKIDVPQWASRTLRASAQDTQTYLIYKMTPGTCELH